MQRAVCDYIKVATGAGAALGEHSMVKFALRKDGGEIVSALSANGHLVVPL